MGERKAYDSMSCTNAFLSEALVHWLATVPVNENHLGELNNQTSEAQPQLRLVKTESLQVESSCSNFSKFPQCVLLVHATRWRKTISKI